MSTYNMEQQFFSHPTAVIDEGCKIGKDTKIWHFSHVMPKAVIGQHCNIGQNVYIDNNVTIGNGVKIQNNVSVYNGVVVEDDAFLGPSMVFTNVNNPRSFIERKNEFRITRVKKGASIGANATIICGNTIGEYAFVGAGSVVTKDVQAYSLVVGNPARHTAWMSVRGHKLDFDEKGQATCAESGEKYTLKEGVVSRISV